LALLELPRTANTETVSLSGIDGVAAAHGDG
jgi:hypothetical protein